MKPLLLDLFAGAGGAAAGYHRAGFDVIGVDINPQPDYPFEFVHGDALTELPLMLASSLYSISQRLTVVHASPPCQASCNLTKGTNAGRVYPQLIPATRALLAQTGLPTVIENVQGAQVRRDLTLCGEMFGLNVIRHRYFECSFPVVQPAHVQAPRPGPGLAARRLLRRALCRRLRQRRRQSLGSRSARGVGYRLDRQRRIAQRGDTSGVHRIHRRPAPRRPHPRRLAI